MAERGQERANGLDVLLGWVWKRHKLKNVEFAHIWDGGQTVQLVLLDDFMGQLRLGDYVEVHGRWSPKQSPPKSTDATSKAATFDFNVQSLDILCSPSWTNAKDGMREWMLRAACLSARAQALAAALEVVHDNGLSYRPAPIFVGEHDVDGPTRPFAARHKGRSAFLTVNNISQMIRLQPTHGAKLFDIGHLFWQQHYSNRTSLNEIHTLELCVAGYKRQDMIGLVESMLDRAITAAKHALRAANIDLALQLDLSTQLPVVTYDEAMHLAGVEEERHILPASTNEAVCRHFNSPGFWLTDAPPTTVPYYARRELGDDDVHAASLELRLADVPNIGSGSEWACAVQEGVWHLDDELKDRVPEAHCEALDKGVPPGCGFTLGIDRLIMAMAGAQNIFSVVAQPRRKNSFPRHAKSSAPAKTASQSLQGPQFTETQADHIAKLVKRAMEIFLAYDFKLVSSSMLSDDPTVRDDDIEVDWFQKSVALVHDRRLSLGGLVNVGLNRIMECSRTVSPHNGNDARVTLDAVWTHNDWRDGAGALFGEGAAPGTLIQELLSTVTTTTTEVTKSCELDAMLNGHEECVISVNQAPVISIARLSAQACENLAKPPEINQGKACTPAIIGVSIELGIIAAQIITDQA